MKTTLCAGLILCAFPVTARPESADRSPPKNFVVFGIKTDLQRELLFSTNADVYVQIDVGECLRDGKFDVTRLDPKTLRKELAVLVHQVGKAKPALQIAYRYGGVSLDSKESKAMESAVQNEFRRAGFAKFRTMMNYEGGSWGDKLRRFADLSDEDNPVESPIENEFVRVYPLRTKLSRFVAGDPEFDCFLDLRQPLDGRFKDFSPAARRAIGERLARLHLRQRRKVLFHCLTTTRGQERAQEYFGRRGENPSPADLFVREFGFQSSSNSMTPMSVSPEDLLRKAAPDFTLESLAGGPLHFREMSRGKVAVIAFWGVGCGACCDEAPHLTALHKRFAEKGLVVIGVNGYDESKQLVERFVRSKGLTHSIGLMGSKVAQKYTVASYSVTYLVDRKGAIADYHLGFDAGDEKLLEKGVARLLNEGDKAGAPASFQNP